MTITAREIVYSVKGMSGRPEFYSGRGAVCYDLSGEQLFEIHSKIKEKIGTNESEAFVTMIENLKCLSATNFLNSLYALEANGWVYVPTTESDVDVGPDGPQRETVAMATIFSALSNTNRDDTEFIRNTFFTKIGHPIKQNPRYEDIEGGYWG